MLSARMAEKVAFAFYKQLAYEVEDIAVLQLNGKNSNWKTHDLLLDGKRAVDVKNARRPFNSENFYVEHTIPKFKKDRYDQEIFIAGILSPYLKLECINNPSSVRFKVPPIIYLGETNLGAINTLCIKFSTNKLEIMYPGDYKIPSWLFDYPDEWYRDFDVRCQAFRDQFKWPNDDDNIGPLLYDTLAKLDILPKLIIAAIDLPAYFSERLEPWQVKFCQRLNFKANNRLSIPFIFLTVLSDFLDKLEDEPSHYAPKIYLDLLYQREQMPTQLCPLGLTDPLGVISSLCNALNTLWDHRNSLNLKRFKNFSFRGLGLLQGRESSISQWDTILAYCGGWVHQEDGEGNILVNDNGRPQRLGKCGYSPLVLGQHKLCEICRKLICSECGFCCIECERKKFNQHQINQLDEDNDYIAHKNSMPIRSTYVVVSIGNQDNCGGRPTYSIKDRLKAAGYQWQSIGWPCWEKSFPAIGFSIEAIKSEIGSELSNGIEVRIKNDVDEPIACFQVNDGQWRER